MVTLRCRDLPRKKHEKEEEEEKREKNEIKTGSHQGRREGTTHIRVEVDSPVVLSEWGIVQNVPVCFAAEVFSLSTSTSSSSFPPPGFLPACLATFFSETTSHLAHFVPRISIFRQTRRRRSFKKKGPRSPRRPLRGKRHASKTGLARPSGWYSDENEKAHPKSKGGRGRL